jgi:hypothetical protein
MALDFGGDYEAALHLVGGEPGQAIKTGPRMGGSRPARGTKRISLAAGSCGGPLRWAQIAEQ